MNDLVDMLCEAFEAGQNHATEYEHGYRGYYPDFKKWYELNKKKIEQLHRLLMLSDGHRQYRRNDEDMQRMDADLYNLSTSLRKADWEENEARKDSFDQQLP